MTVKLVLLKSGEDIIADMQEMVVGEDDQKVVGYFLSRPFKTRLMISDNKSDEKEKNSFNINLIPWIPLSKDKIIPVPSDWVVTIVEPVDDLKKMYEEVILKNEQRNSEGSDSSDEGDSDNSD